MLHSLPLDFILSFCRDMIPGHGEDCYCYSFCDTVGLLGVFDGCGGAGARKHEYYSGNTEAFIASRLCAGAFYDSFRATYPCNRSAEQVAKEVFEPQAVQRLIAFEPPKDKDGFLVKGSMVRTLPTTAAAALIQVEDDGQISVSAIWAGDSRVYLLDENGLAQLSTDDTSVPDPMENLYEDGVLKNIFCSDKAVNLHCRTVRLQPPFMVLAATDGCFGYVSTPMEFEGMLLDSLLHSDSVAQWEETLAEMIGSKAGDDHTLCLASFGYSNISKLKKSLVRRFAYLDKNYLKPVSQMQIEDRQSRTKLWNQYKTDYLRYLKDGPA